MATETKIIPVPTSSSKKADIQAYLDAAGIAYETDDTGTAKATNAELLALVPEDAEPITVTVEVPDTTPVAAPPANSYVVKEGDTLATIATSHMMSVGKLKILNPRIPSTNVVKVGQILIVA